MYLYIHLFVYIFICYAIGDFMVSFDRSSLTESESEIFLKNSHK